jgi:hypothetical protein
MYKYCTGRLVLADGCAYAARHLSPRVIIDIATLTGAQVHICVCIYVYMCIFVYVYMCICVYMYICIYVYVYMCIYVYVYMCIYVYMYMYIYVYMHMCICVCIYYVKYVYLSNVLTLIGYPLPSLSLYACIGRSYRPSPCRPVL